MPHTLTAGVDGFDGDDGEDGEEGEDDDSPLPPHAVSIVAAAIAAAPHHGLDRRFTRTALHHESSPTPGARQVPAKAGGGGREREVG
jgi:hypothetical protein